MKAVGFYVGLFEGLVPVSFLNENEIFSDFFLEFTYFLLDGGDN